MIAAWQLQQPDPSTVAVVDVSALLVNLVFGLVYAAILAWTIRRFGRVTTDKAQYTIIFLTLVPTMVLIISVIKHSFALSLGLVGALSIVRFRTPVKEAEELVYLFLAIAVGLGLGADQVIPTSVSFFVVIFVLIGLGMSRRHADLRGLFLDVRVPRPDGGDAPSLTDLDGTLAIGKVGYELKRFVDDTHSVQATYFLQAGSPAELQQTLGSLKDRYAGIEISVIDGSRQLS